MNSNINNIIKKIYNTLLEDDNGNVATYIPQLANVDPKKFAISVTYVNGKEYNIGDFKDHFCLQSCSKPLSYCIARKLNDLEKIHSCVGYEPSGQSFYAFRFRLKNYSKKYKWKSN